MWLFSRMKRYHKDYELPNREEIHLSKRCIDIFSSCLADDKLDFRLELKK